MALCSQKSSSTNFANESHCDEGNQLFNANETITMVKLHGLMYFNNGVHLSIHDEIDGLFKTLDGTGGPDCKDRKQWLSLHAGMPWCRSSTSGRRNIAETRLNYTGDNFNN